MPEKEIDYRRDMPDIQIKGASIEFKMQFGDVVQGAAIVVTLDLILHSPGKNIPK